MQFDLDPRALKKPPQTALPKVEVTDTALDPIARRKMIRGQFLRGEISQQQHDEMMKSLELLEHASDKPAVRDTRQPQETGQHPLDEEAGEQVARYYQQRQEMRPAQASEYRKLYPSLRRKQFSEDSDVTTIFDFPTDQPTQFSDERFTAACFAPAFDFHDGQRVDMPFQFGLEEDATQFEHPLGLRTRMTREPMDQRRMMTLAGMLAEPVTEDPEIFGAGGSQSTFMGDGRASDEASYRGRQAAQQGLLPAPAREQLGLPVADELPEITPQDPGPTEETRRTHLRWARGKIIEALENGDDAEAQRMMEYVNRISTRGWTATPAQDAQDAVVALAKAQREGYVPTSESARSGHVERRY